jgi:hypothetical protein
MPRLEHGHAVPDSQVYETALAERHYLALEQLFGETLRA